MRRFHAPASGKVGRVEGRQLLSSMDEQQSCQARVVGAFSGDLAAVYQFKPAVQNIRSLGEERELISQLADCLSRGRGRPPKTVGRFGTSRDRPEFHQDLSADEQGSVARKQVLYGSLGDAMLGASVVRESQEYVRIDEQTHQS
jgi:hypothetical protein